MHNAILRHQTERTWIELLDLLVLSNSGHRSKYSWSSGLFIPLSYLIPTVLKRLGLKSLYFWHPLLPPNWISYNFEICQDVSKNSWDMSKQDLAYLATHLFGVEILMWVVLRTKMACFVLMLVICTYRVSNFFTCLSI